MVNLTHEWEREIREWDICERDKIVNFAAFYFMNYDCEFETLNCTTNQKEQSLSDIFGKSCFDDIRVIRLPYPPGTVGRRKRETEPDTGMTLDMYLRNGPP